MANYLNYGPVMTAEPPIICKGAELYVFGIKADRKVLHQLCHRVFNQPSGDAVKCQALGDYVILIFGTIKKVSGVVPGPGVRERNVLLHVPVLVETAHEAFPALFSPFVWVDNPNSITGGREVFGYAKTFGAIEIDPSAEPSAFSLDTFGGNQTDEFWNLQNGTGFIRVKHKQKLKDPLFSIMDLVGGVDEIGGLIDEWSSTGVKEIFYKQFRAITPGNPAPACFAQIATAEYVLFGGEPKIDPLTHLYEIRLRNLDSHPVVAELGLQPVLESPGYRVQTSFTLGDSVVLWHG